MAAMRLDLIGRYLRPHRRTVLLGALALVVVNTRNHPLQRTKTRRRTRTISSRRALCGLATPLPRLIASGRC